MNVLTVSGRLTADAESKTLESGKSVISFSLADNLIYFNAKGEKVTETEFHNCEKWSSQESGVVAHMTKGKSVTVSGRLVTNKWTTEEGLTRERKILRVDSIELQG